MSERVISAIVVHRTESGRTAAEVGVAEAKQGCGYHYFIDAAGKVEPLTLNANLVWHALEWSHCSIAIAVYGDFDPSEHGRNAHPRPEQIAALVELCAALWRSYGVLPILGHTDLPRATRYPTKRCPGANLDLRAVERDVFLAYSKTPPVTKAMGECSHAVCVSD